MFLVGGPPFSGTTLLAFLLTQGNLFCLDEPDFHNPEQSHRGIPFLKKMFPGAELPEDPRRHLNQEETINLVKQCEEALRPINLGIKMCNREFIDQAIAYKKKAYPIIAIIRDVRDALVTPLPDWITETGVNHFYRLIWEHREMYDLWIRYEELVSDTEVCMQKISKVLHYSIQARSDWKPENVSGVMLKTERHRLLKSGRIMKDRIGIWRSSGKTFSEETELIAKMTGY